MMRQIEYFAQADRSSIVPCICFLQKDCVLHAVLSRAFFSFDNAQGLQKVAQLEVLILNVYACPTLRATVHKPIGAERTTEIQLHSL